MTLELTQEETDTLYNTLLEVGLQYDIAIKNESDATTKQVYRQYQKDTLSIINKIEDQQ